MYCRPSNRSMSPFPFSQWRIYNIALFALIDQLMNRLKIVAPPPFMKSINECICINEINQWLHLHSWNRSMIAFAFFSLFHEYTENRCAAAISWNRSMNAVAFMKCINDCICILHSTSWIHRKSWRRGDIMKSINDCICILEIDQWLHLHSSVYFMNTRRIVAPRRYHKIDQWMYWHSWNVSMNVLAFMK